MRQLRSVRATFLYTAATVRPVGLSGFEPLENFDEFFFERFQDNLTSGISHPPRADHGSEEARLPEWHSRWPRDRRSIVVCATSGARGKVVYSGEIAAPLYPDPKR